MVGKAKCKPPELSLSTKKVNQKQYHIPGRFAEIRIRVCHHRVLGRCRGCDSHHIRIQFTHLCKNQTLQNDSGLL